jgi:hypothetical protein
MESAEPGRSCQADATASEERGCSCEADATAQDAHVLTRSHERPRESDPIDQCFVCLADAGAGSG